MKPEARVLKAKIVKPSHVTVSRCYKVVADTAIGFTIVTCLAEAWKVIQDAF